MSDAHDKASESALKLVTSFGTLGVGIAAFGLGVKMITNSADVSAHELMMWDAGLAKNVGLLERDRILRQRNLAQATSASAQEFTQAENRAEQATAPIRQSFQSTGAKVAPVAQMTAGAPAMHVQTKTQPLPNHINCTPDYKGELVPVKHSTEAFCSPVSRNAVGTHTPFTPVKP